MTAIAYIFFAAIALFLLSMAIFLIRDALTSKPKKTGLNKQYAQFLEAIKYTSHPVELTFLDNDIMDWYNANKNQKGCKEFYDDLMQEARLKDIELKKALLKQKVLPGLRVLGGH